MQLIINTEKDITSGEALLDLVVKKFAIEQNAIERLKAASEMSLQYYQKPLAVCISGGKDSSVITELAIREGIPVEFMHNLTTADAPETVRFVLSEFKRLEDRGYKCTLNKPTYNGKRASMWSLIRQKLMPPTRTVRYCCSVLKENGGKNRFICTGVRWDESQARKDNRGVYEKLGATKQTKIILNNDNDDKRMLFEHCRLKSKRVVNPIIDWKDDNVYNFLIDAKAPMNPLYAEGLCRIGCIGCPMASKKRREAEFLRWPKYKDLYIRAFDRMLDERRKRGKLEGSWQMGTRAIDVFNWWMEYDILPGQMDMEELLEEIQESEEMT